MANFFSPNIDRKGRIVRAIIGAVLLLGAFIIYGDEIWRRWTCVGLLISGTFVLFEAFRGWCLARACGIKTRL